MQVRWPVVLTSCLILGCSPFAPNTAPPAAPGAGPTIGEPPPAEPTPAEPTPAEPTPAEPSITQPPTNGTVTPAADDRDRDNIPDASDRCPDAAEVVNGIDDADGCPDQAVARPPAPALDAVGFAENAATMAAGSQPTIDRVVAALKQDVTARVQVVGHTHGGESRKLGLERAEAVRDALIAGGIDGARIEVRNVGGDKPAADAVRSRRVEFVILTP